MRWSPYSREACSIEMDDGIKIGFGVHPVFDIVPGAWNIFWLTFAQLDQVAHYKGELEQYLITCDALAVCAGAALQNAPPPMQARTLGDLAVELRPKEFVEVVKKIPTFLPFTFYGAKWFNVASSRAARYRVMPDNVVRIDFRKGG